MRQLENSCAWLLLVLALSAPAQADDEPAASPVTPETAAAPETSAVETSEATSLSIEKLTEQVRRSVVVISSTGRDSSRENLGSGFIIGEGLVATNFHVIGDGRPVRVQLADGRQVEVTGIQAHDRNLDLAILKADTKSLPVLPLGNSDELKQGQTVLALGNPRGLKLSVVTGVVSGVREMDGRPMIQLAIPIEPGNSGGPLVDLQGRVQGIVTMKSLVTPNLGFALASKLLGPLLDKPNPMPIERWLTIGAIDARHWRTLYGARWRQRAGRITVEGLGESFGGRSLCLAQKELPERPFEFCVTVKLDDEAGAAGLAFCADEQGRHYGFYPTGGSLRLTRFDGPDVTSWNILYDQPSKHYRPGEWNTLRVRLEDGKIVCHVNDQPVVELADRGLTAGRVGLVKFRQTKAEFKHFRLGREVPRASAPAELAERIESLTLTLAPSGSFEAKLVDELATDAQHSAAVLRERAQALEQQAERLRQLAQSAHEAHVLAELKSMLDRPEDEVDLFRAGLLLAWLDNEDLDVQHYREQLDEMAGELLKKLPSDPTEAQKLAALHAYLFEENGFHGSRGDYYNRSNSYLNEVLDDREGLPITLSVVYMELGRRMGLRIVGVGLPGHFVVRHVPAEGEPQLIDVFERAAPVSLEEASKRVKEASDRELTDELLAPMTKRAILTRMLTNLLGISGSDPRAMHRYLNAILLMEPENGQYHWLRAIVRYRLDESAGALEDVAWLLDKEPAGIDLPRVMELQQAIQRKSAR